MMSSGNGMVRPKPTCGGMVEMMNVTAHAAAPSKAHPAMSPRQSCIEAQPRPACPFFGVAALPGGFMRQIMASGSAVCPSPVRGPRRRRIPCDEPPRVVDTRPARLCLAEGVQIGQQRRLSLPRHESRQRGTAWCTQHLARTPGKVWSACTPDLRGETPLCPYLENFRVKVYGMAAERQPEVRAETALSLTY